MSDDKIKINIEELASFCKRKGIVFKAAEIYGGLAGFFDFGPIGVELKNNLKNLYWKHFVLMREDMVGQDGSIITNPNVWKASGHVDSFGDLILTTKETKTKLRADHFIEDELNIPADGMKAKEIQELIDKNKLKYNGEDFEEIKDFNLMFSTHVGADTTKSSIAYLRPETCQSIFPNFKLIVDSARQQLPFGIVQVGKAFRNEISPRDFVFRSREFEQIEMEYFFNPEVDFDGLTDKELKTRFKFLSAQAQDAGLEDMEEITLKELIDRKKISKIHGFWLAQFYNFFTEKLGIKYDNLRVREHVKTELSHYSAGTFDIDYNYPFGFKEMLGMANRTNFDLRQHSEHSKSSLEIFDEKTKSKVMAHVIEPSVGVERMLMAVIYEAYEDDKTRGNIVLKFNPLVSPSKVAVFPLMNKPELVDVARELYNEFLDEDIVAVYDKSGSIGKRYARQDEIGTPYCITVDYETIEDGKDKGTVTIRDRDSTLQKRVDIKMVSGIVSELVKGRINFKDLK